MNPLIVIKRLVLRGSIRFTEKVRLEMDIDSITADEVAESIVNARKIDKTIRSTSPLRRHAGKRLYIIKSSTYDGTRIYSKGSIVTEEGQDVFYIFVLAKRSFDE